MFYKVLKDNLTHHNFQYKEGLNVDTLPFNPKGECTSGGLYYTDKPNVINWALSLDCSLIADVTIPEDAKVYKEICGTKWKADRLILSNIRPISTFFSECTDEEQESMLFNTVIDNIQLTPSEAVIVRRRVFGNSPRLFLKQTRVLCIRSVKYDPYSIQYVRDQTPELCALAVSLNPHTIQYVRDQTLELCKMSITKTKCIVSCIKQTPELCEFAVQNDGNAIVSIIDQTPELCELAVKQNGMALRWIRNQTPELCRLAIEQNGCALQYVIEQTPELCELAVQRCCCALKYVKNQTVDICKKSLRARPASWRHIRSWKTYMNCLMG